MPGGTRLLWRNSFTRISCVPYAYDLPENRVAANRVEASLRLGSDAHKAKLQGFSPLDLTHYEGTLHVEDANLAEVVLPELIFHDLFRLQEVSIDSRGPHAEDEMCLWTTYTLNSDHSALVCRVALFASDVIYPFQSSTMHKYSFVDLCQEMSRALGGCITS